MFSKNTLYHRVVSILLIATLLLLDLRLDWVEAEVSPKDSKKLKIDKLFIAPKLGIISERYKGKKDRLFILIQDLHCTPDAQRSIANLIHFFVQNYRVRSLALEGATGLVDPEPLGSFPDEGMRETVLNQLLEEGSLTGAEWLAARTQTSLNLWGVEDPRLYDENLKAYQKTEAFNNEVARFLASLKLRLQKIKMEQLSEHLFRLDKAYWKYRDGKLDLSSILELLEDVAQQRGLILPKVLRNYIRLMDLSIRVDSNKLNAEIRDLTEKISKKLTKDDLKKFLKSATIYRLGKGSEIDFLRGLKEWSKKQVIDLKDYPQFQLYFKGQILRSKISLSELRSSLERWAVRILSDSSRDLFEKTRRWHELRDLLMLQLSSDDWAKISNIDLFVHFSFLTAVQNPGETRGFISAVPTRGFRQPVGGSAKRSPLTEDDQANGSLIFKKEWLDAARSFYEAAEKRNETLFTRTFALMKRKNLSSVMMITGGFHTDGIKKELRRHGFSYVVILPAAKNVTASRYRDLLLAYPSSFDRLLLDVGTTLISEKSILSAERGLAPALRTAVEPFYPWLRPLILRKAFLFYALLCFWESGAKPSETILAQARHRLLASVQEEERESLKIFLDSLEMGRLEGQNSGHMWLKGRIEEKEWIFILGKNLDSNRVTVKEKVVAEGLLKKNVFYQAFRFAPDALTEYKKIPTSFPREMVNWLRGMWKKVQLFLSNRYSLAGLTGLGSTINFLILFAYAALSNPDYHFGQDFLSMLGEGNFAWAFNQALILSGVFLTVFGWFSLKPLLKSGKWTRVGLGLLSISGIFLGLVGVFPTYYGVIHDAVAVAFFLFISVALLSLFKPMAASRALGWSVAIWALIAVILSLGLVATFSPAFETAAVMAHFAGIFVTSVKLLKFALAFIKEKSEFSSIEAFKDELLWWMIYAKEEEIAKAAEKIYLSLPESLQSRNQEKNMTQKEFAQMVDDTLLGPGISEAKIDQKVQDAIENGSGLVMLMPLDIPVAAESLKKRNARGIKLGAVVGFPLSGFTETKLIETEYAIKHGAAEIDMVMDHASLVRGRDFKVLGDIRAVVRKAKELGGPKTLIKVIIETGILTEEEKIRAARLVRLSGAESVKTSTGFFGGAKAEDVALLRLVSGSDFMVKASGGIQKRDDATRMIEVGADRLGVSKSSAVLSGFPKEGKMSIEVKGVKGLLERVWELREKVMRSGNRALTKRIEAYGSERRENETELAEKMDQRMLEKLERVDLPARINLVNLRPKLARKDLEEMADAMAHYGFRAAIVSSIHVKELFQIFQKKGIGRSIIATVGYPFNTLTAAKEFEAEQAIRRGAQGIKTVMDIALLRRGEIEKALEDLKSVIHKARENSQGKIEVDVILDAALLREGLSDSEGDQLVREAAKIIMESGAHGISLNTGWKGEAEVRDIVIVREVVGREFRVAASGGVRTLKKAVEMIEAGADQVSASDVEDIMVEYAKVFQASPKVFSNEELEIFDVAA